MHGGMFMPRHDPEERTKMAIINTAARLFGEKGWSNVNIEDVVREVGVTRGAFYHYFGSREDLIYAVIVQPIIDNDPFALAAKEKGLNALGKLRFALKFSLQAQLSAVLSSNMLQTMYDPAVMKSNINFSIDVMGAYIEKLLVEGMEDGSMPVKYPKHTAQAAGLIFNEWLNPTLFRMTDQEFRERILFLEEFGERLGMPVIDDELKEMLWQLFEYYKQT